MFLELIKASALLLSLSLLQGLVIRFLNKYKIIKEIISGLVFGIVCVVGMMLPIEIEPGLIFDPRSVVLAMAGLFGGPIVGFIAATIAGGYRVFLGGGGVYVGVSVIIVCTLLGIGYRYAVNKGWAKVDLSQLFLFGLIVHLIELLIFTQLPADVVRTVMATVALPIVLIFTPATAFLGVLLKDIEDRIKTETALKESESRLSHHLEHTPLAVISWDLNFRITQWNKTAEDIFGYSTDEVMGKPFLEFLINADGREEADKVISALLSQKGGSRSTSKNITKDGGSIVCDWYNTPILDDVGKVIGVSSLAEDVTAKKESEALIWRQANFDLLTGLANRQLANDRLEQEIRKADRFNKKVAVLYLDLDNFKDINDTRGHDMGDILLVELAKRLRACIRDIDTVARLGGDEFIIIMGDLDRLDRVERVADKILGKTFEPYKLGSEEVNVSCSLGITFYPDDASDAVGLLKNADQAMYAAKIGSGNNFQYFKKSMYEAALTRMTLLKDLRMALTENQFQLYYQPIVRMADGVICKAEALIRWNHPKKGNIPPSEFIPIAEETRMIFELGDWVFKEAVKQSVHWRKIFGDSFQIGINTSPVQYRHDNFKSRDWLDFLSSLDLSTKAIVIEITEGTLMETHSSIVDKLLEFRDAGIQIALDDFGTGYSSLSYLQKLDIDYLKIDKSFVDNLSPDSNELVLCEAIIVMAHKLNLKVIAEGIETQQQSDLLTSAGCDCAQGYLFSKPLPAEEFEALFSPNINKPIPNAIK